MLVEITQEYLKKSKNTELDLNDLKNKLFKGNFQVAVRLTLQQRADMGKFIPKKVLCVLCTLILTLLPTPSFASDLELPVLEPNSGQFNATSLYPGDSLTATFRITDDVGCCDWTGMGLYTNPGQNVNTVQLTWSLTPGFSRVSGSATDGRYSYTIQIPSNASPGTYYVKAQATDIATRYTHLEQIGSITIQSRPSTGSSSSNSNPQTNSTTTQSSVGSITVGVGEVVSRSTMLSNLGITKGKRETVTYAVSRQSRKVCSLTRAGIKAKTSGICTVAVNKTDGKRKKTKATMTITFTN